MQAHDTQDAVRNDHKTGMEIPEGQFTQFCIQKPHLLFKKQVMLPDGNNAQHSGDDKITFRKLRGFLRSHMTLDVKFITVLSLIP